ncbi:hypothetical protein [Desertibacillus haloalkaliphilus]|uniref:hypothetical protein n=1 Tax=Desertibacillus haloalkaliphilus TaxID=1328930 RepID=UPI001C270AEB|nr:hypothetical protein [Desertibacillus haloalkaliphilus]MBU8907401.1 hypothetical protein [Desertibacillus haloalkaliphilus]
MTNLFIEAFVFSTMITIPFVLAFNYFKHHKHKKHRHTVDHERLKCESDLERDVYDFLKANGYRVKARIPCGQYFIDIALPKKNIAIECHKDPNKNKHEKIIRRQKIAYFKKRGWNIVHIHEQQMNSDYKKAMNQLEQEINGNRD